MKRTNSINIIRRKILRRLLHIRLQPIRVFCFHHVSEIFDETTMYRIDWLRTDEFKQAVGKLRKEGYTFISLSEAYEKLTHDTFRFRKYAVLTADDGWASLRNILPWLNDEKIPITLFLNPAYLDGKHFREKQTESYLLQDEIESMHKVYPLVTVGSHGMEHIEVTKQSLEEFYSSIAESIRLLQQLPNYIPYYAFPYGKYTKKCIDIVIQNNLIPLLVSGENNYTLDKNYIDREILGAK